MTANADSVTSSVEVADSLVEGSIGLEGGSTLPSMPFEKESCMYVQAILLLDLIFQIRRGEVVERCHCGLEVGRGKLLLVLMRRRVSPIRDHCSTEERERVMV